MAAVFCAVKSATSVAGSDGAGASTSPLFDFGGLSRDVQRISIDEKETMLRRKICCLHRSRATIRTSAIAQQEPVMPLARRALLGTAAALALPAQMVKLPRCRRAASYSAEFVIRCRCLGMW
jgi:hypothetical protein